MVATDSPNSISNGYIPIIGISAAQADSKSLSAIMTMVRSLGAEPRLLSNHSQRISLAGGLPQLIKEDMEALDAVIIMGNNSDIDPAKYGAARHPETNIETDLARASYEEALIKEAMAGKMPLLGICGGHQRINILAGGTLHQHLPDIVGNNHHAQGDIPGFIPVEYIGIANDTMLGDMAATINDSVAQHQAPKVVVENSFHHQAVDKVANGFRVAAVSADGMIEGIECDPLGPYRDQFIMGVQRHPEFGASPLGPKIVGRVISEAKYYAQAHSKSANEPQHNFTENLLSSLNVIHTRDPQEAAIGLTGGKTSMLDMVLNRRRSDQSKEYNISL